MAAPHDVSVVQLMDDISDEVRSGEGGGRSCDRAERHVRHTIGQTGPPAPVTAMAGRRGNKN